jgi:hypothetical protein
MGTKVMIIAAMLGMIASSGLAFAYAPQSRDGLSTTGLTLTIRKAKTIRLVQPQTQPPRSAAKAG